MNFFYFFQFKTLNNLLDSKINVFLNTEAKASSVAKVPPKEFILLHLQPTFQKLHSLVTPDGNIACNLFITPDSKGSNGIPCCGMKNRQLKKMIQNRTRHNNMLSNTYIYLFVYITKLMN